MRILSVLFLLVSVACGVSLTTPPNIIFSDNKFIYVMYDNETVYAYTLPTYTVTEPTTNYPVGFAAFAFDGTNSASANTPEIAEWTRQNDPGDTLALTCESLSETNALFVFGGTTSNYYAGDVLCLDDRQAAVTLPDSLPEDDVYLMWPFNVNGFGEPVPINAAEAWWVGFDTVSTGDTFSVYGQNLELDGSSYAYVDGYGWLSTTKCNPYKADFVVPADMANGSYTIYAHNGHGGAYGWSDGFELTVQGKTVYDEDTNTWVYVASTNFTDVQSAISSGGGKTVYFPAGDYLISSHITLPSAMRIKGAGMDQTTLTAAADMGGYAMLSWKKDNVTVEDIELNSGVYEMDGVVKVEKASSTNPTTDACFNRVRMSSLNNTNLYNASPIELKSLVYRTKFKDCEFIITGGSNSIWLDDPDQVLFDGCDFFGVRDCNVMVGLYASRVAFVGCTAQNYDNSDASVSDGWAKGRWVCGNSAGANNVYIGDSTTYDLRPRIPSVRWSGTGSDTNYVGIFDADEELWEITLNEDLDLPSTFDGRATLSNTNYTDNDGNNGTYIITDVDNATDTITIRYYISKVDNPDPNGMAVEILDGVDQNSGEQIMHEGGDIQWQGQVVSASGTNITLTGVEAYADTDLTSIAIVKGTGLGQWKPVVSVSINTVSVASEWRVPPDSTSTVIIGNWAYNWAVYSNMLDGVPTNVYSASCGVQIYGGGTKFVADSNVISEMYSGLMYRSTGNVAENSSETCFRPVMWATAKNNMLTNYQFCGLFVDAHRTGGTLTASNNAAILGCVIRDNTLDGDPISMTSGYRDAPVSGQVGVYTTVFDGNDARSATSAYMSLGSITNQVFSGNEFSGSGIALTAGNEAILHGNNYSGFDSNYTLSAESIWTPIKSVHFDADYHSASVPVYNVGTAPANWTASTDATWLNLSGASGTIDAEGSGAFNLSTSSLPATDTNSLVTVIGDTTTNYVTVFWDAGE